MSADDFIADCFQRDEGCRHGVNTAGVNLDVCSQCVRDAYEAQPSLTPADLIERLRAASAAWRAKADALRQEVKSRSQPEDIAFGEGRLRALHQCADQLDEILDK